MKISFATLNSRINFNLMMFSYKQLNNERRLKIYDKYIKRKCFSQITKRKMMKKKNLIKFQLSIFFVK